MRYPYTSKMRVTHAIVLVSVIILASLQIVQGSKKFNQEKPSKTPRKQEKADRKQERKMRMQTLRSKTEGNGDKDASFECCKKLFFTKVENEVSQTSQEELEFLESKRHNIDMFVEEVIAFRIAYENEDNLLERSATLAKFTELFLTSKRLAINIFKSLKHKNHDRLQIGASMAHLSELYEFGAMSVSELLDTLVEGMLIPRKDFHFESLQDLWANGFDYLKNSDFDYYNNCGLRATKLKLAQKPEELSKYVEGKAKQMGVQQIVGFTDRVNVIVNIDDPEWIHKRSFIKSFQILFKGCSVHTFIHSSFLNQEKLIVQSELSLLKTSGFIFSDQSLSGSNCISRIMFINDLFQAALTLWSKDPGVISKFLLYQSGCPSALKLYEDNPNALFLNLVHFERNSSVVFEKIILFRPKNCTLSLRPSFLQQLDHDTSNSAISAYLHTIQSQSSELTTFIFGMVEKGLGSGRLTFIKVTDSLLEGCIKPGKSPNYQEIKANFSAKFIHLIKTSHKETLKSLVSFVEFKFNLYDNIPCSSIEKLKTLREIKILFCLLDEETIDLIIQASSNRKKIALLTSNRFLGPFLDFSDTNRDLVNGFFCSPEYAALGKEDSYPVVLKIIQQNPSCFTDATLSMIQVIPVQELLENYRLFSLDHYINYWDHSDHTVLEKSQVVANVLYGLLKAANFEKIMNCISRGTQGGANNLVLTSNTSNSSAIVASTTQEPVDTSDQTGYSFTFIKTVLFKFFADIFKSSQNRQLFVSFLTQPLIDIIGDIETSEQLLAAVRLWKLLDTSEALEIIKIGSAREKEVLRLISLTAIEQTANSSHECPICFYEFEKLKTFSCKHGVCESCATKITLCPICRGAL